MTFWTELKLTAKEFLPYVLLVGVGVLYAQQTERMVTDHLLRLETQLTQHSLLLNSLRDELIDSGLAVPPFRAEGFSDD
jgi:hypothetical protein